MRDSFIKGLVAADHTYEISDLYALDFKADISESEYRRESYYNRSLPLSEDVILEQEKIKRADAIVFIYPVFWTEAPAKLVGWFQRVWSFGFSYGEDCTMPALERALFLVTMGADLSDPTRAKQAAAMKTVMLGDRIGKRAKRSDMVVFERMSRGYPEERAKRMAAYLSAAYECGKTIALPVPFAEEPNDE